MTKSCLKSAQIVCLLVTLQPSVAIALTPFTTTSPTGAPDGQRTIEVETKLKELERTADEIVSRLENLRTMMVQVPSEQRDLVLKIDDWTTKQLPKLQDTTNKIASDSFSLSSQLQSHYFSTVSLVLSVAGVVIAALGLLTYQVLLHKLKGTLDAAIRQTMAEEHTTVISSIQEEVNKSALFLYSNLSMVFWEQYETLRHKDTDMEQDSLAERLYRFALEQAIELATGAHLRAEQLDKQKFETVIYETKNSRLLRKICG